MSPLKFKPPPMPPDAWPTLPEAIRAGILVMVRAAGVYAVKVYGTPPQARH